MGEEALKIWQTMRNSVPAAASESESLSQQLEQSQSGLSAPSQFSFDGADFKSMQASPELWLGYKQAPSKYPVAAAWHRLVWTCTQREVDAKFGTENRLHIAPTQKGSLEASYFMSELFARLFQGVTHQHEATDSDLVEQWRGELHALHDAVHHKLEDRRQCRICQGARLWKDCRKQHAEWNFDAVKLLWEAIVSTVCQHGIGWSMWRSSRPSAPGPSPPLPAKLEQVQEVPIDQVQMLPDGRYKWGGYTTKPGMESLEAAHAVIDAEYKEYRRHRIAAITEAHQQSELKAQNHPGDKLELRQNNKAKVFVGRVWRSEDQWSFQEEGTGIKVTVDVNPLHSLKQRYEHCEEKLYKSLKAEHEKSRKAAAKADKKARQRADVPKTTADMSVKGKSSNGKLLYTWGDSSRGRIEVEVTPRKLRADAAQGDTAFKQASARETTPERALRKMTQKVRRIQAKALRGEQERITARAPTEPGAVLTQSQAMDESSYSPALRQLSDTKYLQYAIDIYEYSCGTD